MRAHVLFKRLMRVRAYAVQEAFACARVCSSRGLCICKRLMHT